MFEQLFKHLFSMLVNPSIKYALRVLWYVIMLHDNKGVKHFGHDEL